MNERTNKASLERIAELEALVESLRERIDILEGIPSLRAGIRGETLIAQRVNGRMTIHTAPHDIVVTNGIKLEVKYARLNTPNNVCPTRRWSWNHPLGQKRGKDFHRLILVGEADSRFRPSYKDPNCPYVIFDVPRDRVVAMNQADNHISIVSNPARCGAGTTRDLLFRHFQTTLAELETRYGIIPNDRNG